MKKDEELKASGKGESFEGIIDIDLKRSVSCLEPTDLEPVKRILMNIALHFNELGYYQGANYIAIFLFDFCQKNDEEAFRLMSVVVERFTEPNFSQKAGGIVKPLWITNRVVQISNPHLTEKFRENNITALHFAISNILTLLSSLIKNKQTFSLAEDVWDLMFCGGIQKVFSCMLYFFDVQKAFLANPKGETNNLSAMKDIDSEPFILIRKSGVSQTVVDNCLRHLNKPNLREVPWDPKIYGYIALFFEVFGKANQETWA